MSFRFICFPYLCNKQNGDMTIDYVVPMVFPDDPKWRHDYARAYGVYSDDRSALTNVRYRSWGTERLLVQCIRKNLPWVRDIIILLARKSQVQQWMLKEIAATRKDMSHIRIVFHNEFMSPDVLPTFNSRAIEMYLHRIPNLAPYFLYGNDDMFPLAPMSEDDFFRNGLPCLHYTDRQFDPSNTFHRACMNGMNFVAADFGQHYDNKWLHIGHNIVPILKSTCEHFWQQHPKEMQASVSRFRMPHNYNQYIYSWWQILSGQYVDHNPPRDYVSVTDAEDTIRHAIRNADGLLCVNDRNTDADITSLAAMVRHEISLRL